uniref:Uncharacterized protein n=1 Tax=Roseihalotalea indica TaxID=2867963 RepID=A0AA49JF58_9BACT|nr:hypothetical protein K4G66_22365 [Tunicatimonas sp. TK19036]
MKAPAVRKLVENYTIDQLTEAEHALVQDRDLPFMVEGRDESEKLTHLLAAAYILERMKTENLEFRDAFREYSQRVRESIN